jgi:biopolymer transport protein ExbD
MKFNRKAKVGSVIPTASMADISFLLLVFFMVSTVFVRYRSEFRVVLPEAEKIDKLDRRDIVNVWVGSEGQIQVDDLSVKLEQIGKAVHAKLTANPAIIVLIKADQKAKFGLVSDVMQEMRKIEALRVNFATSREE